jgi:L-amino acid N-acyltransferase YncA
MNLVEILKKVKLRYPVVWDWVEDINGILLDKSQPRRMSDIKRKISVFPPGHSGLVFRDAKKEDIPIIVEFLNHLSAEDVAHFRPFPFTDRSLDHVISCGTYQVYKAMSKGELVGFFFLRFFINSQCYLGFAVKSSYRGKGIGKKMIEAMASAVKDSGFQLMSTVCADNQASIKAHMAAAQFEIVSHLSSDEIVLRLKD